MPTSRVKTVFPVFHSLNGLIVVDITLPVPSIEGTTYAVLVFNETYIFVVVLSKILVKKIYQKFFVLIRENCR
jgi:hypothetical protein